MQKEKNLIFPQHIVSLNVVKLNLFTPVPIDIDGGITKTKITFLFII